VVTVVAPYSKGIVAAAEHGWYPISGNFLQTPWVATHWPLSKQGRENVGAVADPKDWRIARSIFVADDEQTAARYAKGSDGPYSQHYWSLLTKLKWAGRINLFKTYQDHPDEDVTLEPVVESLVIAAASFSLLAAQVSADTVSNQEWVASQHFNGRGIGTVHAPEFTVNPDPQA